MSKYIHPQRVGKTFPRLPGQFCCFERTNFPAGGGGPLSAFFWGLGPFLRHIMHFGTPIIDRTSIVKESSYLHYFMASDISCNDGGNSSERSDGKAAP